MAERKWIKRGIKLSLSLVLLLVLLEGGSRVYFKATYGVSLRHPSQMIYAFYPQLRQVQSASITKDDESYDVLLLGGSVMQRTFTTHLIDKGLLERGREKVNVLSLAKSGQTSRDSLMKYRRIPDKQFDLVIFYQSINEVRANNCPSDMFREDYSHYAPYPVINPIIEGDGSSFALPVALRFLWMQLVSIPRGEVVPNQDPREEYLEYGAEIKTKAAYRANVGEIVKLARERGAAILLVTFTYYLPENYSREAFENGSLDYTPKQKDSQWKTAPIELWGLRENVIKGIDAHNDALRDIPKNYGKDRSVMLLDLQADFPRQGAFFTDVCHLSPSGRKRFVDAITAALASHGENAP